MNAQLNEVPENFLGYFTVAHLLEDYSLHDIQLMAMGIPPKTVKEVNAIALRLKTVYHNLSGYSWSEYECTPNT